MLIPYLVATLAPVAAAFARYELNPIWGSKLPFITFYPAVALAAWLGGVGPGLVATAVSAICALLFLQPLGSLRVNDLIGLTLFVLVNVLITTLNEALHRARRRAEIAATAHWQSEEQLRGVFTSATDAIITIDAGQKITLFNAGAEVTFGYPADEMIGHRLDRLIPERFREVHRQHVDAFGATGISMRAMGGERILTGLRQNGDEFPMEARISQVEIGGHKLYTVILRDITDRKRAEAEREELLAIAQQARRELEVSNRRKDEFLAMLGHELRNPLSAIRNAVATASLDEARRGRALEIARRQADQLARLIDDLLDVARITQGRILLRKERASLVDIIERAVESTRSFIDSQGLRLTASLPSEPIRVAADPAGLGRCSSTCCRMLLSIPRRADGST